MTDSTTIAFLEYPREAEAYLSRLAPGGGTARSGSPTIVALNPATRAYLSRQGFAAESSLPYLTPASRRRALQCSEELTRWMREHFDFVDSRGVRADYLENLVWFTRWLTNYLLWFLEILDNAATIHGAQKLVTCRPQPSDFSGPYAGCREPYLNLMSERFAQDRKIETSPVPVRAGASARETAARALHSLATRMAANPVVARFHRKQLARLARHNPVLFTSQYYRLNVLAGRVKEEQGALPVLLSDWGSHRSPGWPFTMKAPAPFTAEARLSLLEPLAPDNDDSRRCLKEAIARFAGEVARETKLFSHLGVSFSDVTANKIRWGIGPSILGLHRRAATLQMLLDNLKPSLALSNGCRIDDMMIGELCQAGNIPAMMITHGSHVPPSNDAERYEWGEHGRRLINAPYRFTSLQSPLAEEFRKVFPSESEGARTGPLIWAKSGNQASSASLREQMLGGASRDKVIVHAGTPKGRMGMRFHVSETPDEYVQSIGDLVRAVEEVPNARLIVMFRPSPEIGLDDLKALVPFSEKVIVNVNAPLVDVLGFADILVSFSSTVIEEALQNRVPVLQYGGGGRYQHIKAPGITRDNFDASGPVTIYHVKNSVDLPYAFKRILSAGSRGFLDKSSFSPYVYQCDQVTPFAQLVRSLRDGVDS